MSDTGETIFSQEERRPQRKTYVLMRLEENHVLCGLELLLGGAEKDSRNGSSKTPLIIAASHEQLGAIEKLSFGSVTNLDIRTPPWLVRPRYRCEGGQCGHLESASSSWR